MVELLRHRYRYYPYELELARRELQTLVPHATITETENGFGLRGALDTKVADRLVYFAAADDGKTTTSTLQARLERVNGNGVNRQSTRYSAHGLHEYKGKFNPQVARAILNILDVPVGAKVIDPFCGSGTSLIECTHLGIKSVGADINPLAIFIANTKLISLTIPAVRLRKELTAVMDRLKKRRSVKLDGASERLNYLSSWFDIDVLNRLENLRTSLQRSDGVCAGPLLAIASNLLREYSLQDPNDLRIRRRKSPLPEKPFEKAFEESALRFIAKLEDAQKILRPTKPLGKAFLIDSKDLTAKRVGLGSGRFDCALTSPPYATALPYIDTQRLSLVWLGLILPSEIHSLEARLVGSREIRGQSKREMLSDLLANSSSLPSEQQQFCHALQAALTPSDGFRRRAVPVLLYRYFSSMATVFRTLKPLMKKRAPFALIVGSNHTVLGGKRFDIDTPKHLAAIAESSGWTIGETIPLQTYRRYGLHMNNAVVGESLVVVRAS